MKTKTPQDARILDLAEPLAEELGLEVVRVRVMSGKRPRLQIMTDRLDGKGVDEDDVDSTKCTGCGGGGGSPGAVISNPCIQRTSCVGSSGPWEISSLSGCSGVILGIQAPRRP